MFSEKGLTVLNEEEESTLLMMDLGDAIVVDNLGVGRGSIFTMGHECEEPTHAEENCIPVLAFQITDVNGKQHLLVAPIGGTVVNKMCDMEFVYNLRSLCEVDN